MKLDVRDNFASAKAALQNDAKQAPFALAVALTRTVQDVRTDEKTEMGTSFSKPTSFTLNSLFIKPATKQTLTASVWVKDSERPSHYLLPQIEGGARQQKRFEQLLLQRGLMRANERAVPGIGAKLDSFGNMGRGQITKILSQLKTFNLAGSDANATDSKRSKSKRVREAYFVSTGQGTHPFGKRSWRNGRMKQHLPRGIWVRTASATGTTVKPILLFVSKAVYGRRFKFYEVADRTINRVFEGHFDREYAKALKSARPGGAT
ncbi:hypothetical protein [Variovorax sp. IB41]|uniref:hypothetical protein n=1 Tax=Variovorax sp. IB41 TaxID=2779370 RepID=UPI0018E7A3EE|nr:hypothetical protein [Variovorax sp. IB41]MBJ2155276.1 hypothetical protein [Variovorax sp. IB41]